MDCRQPLNGAKTKCSNNNCKNLGLNHCGACKVVYYCSSSCQRENWKFHKKNCGKNYDPIKGMDTFVEESIHRSIALETECKAEEAIDLLKSTLVTVIAQLNHGIEPPMGQNQFVDNHAYNIKVRIRDMCMHIPSRIPEAYLNAEIVRRLIDAMAPTDSCEKFEQLAEAERSLATVFVLKLDLQKAEEHGLKSLVFARQIKKGVMHTTELSRCLKTFAEIRSQQRKCLQAITLSEEAYILLSEAYGPVHPQVQNAASDLIELHSRNGEFENADRYARINYESIIDPNNGYDMDSLGAAQAMELLARLWWLNNGEEGQEVSETSGAEAESLTRQAITIVEKLYGMKSVQLPKFYKSLCFVQMKRGLFTEEVRGILQRVLVLYMGFDGGMGNVTQQGYFLLGSFCKRLALSLEITDPRRKAEFKKACAYHLKALECYPTPESQKSTDELNVIKNLLKQDEKERLPIK